MKRIEIIVTPQGETRLETKGFVGGECQQASRLLEQALGQVAAETRTAEFYADQSHRQIEQEQTSQE